jgi:hypothetical protein
VRRAGGFLVALTALAFASAASAANVLPNPSFEGSLTGWSGWNSTLSQAADGVSGSGALKVVATSTSYSATTSPRPVRNEPAGVTYTGSGWVRSATPGHTICIFLREWDASGQVASSKQCLTATTAWQRLPTVAYTTRGGTSLEEYVYATGASGDSFELDGMSLDDGTGAPPADTTPPDTTITSGPAAGSSTTDTGASFAFTATETSTFQCALDGGAFAACSSPAAYSGLAQGSHTFSVRATDQAGNVDPTPATRTWTVTAPPPPSSDPTMLLVGDQHACDSHPGAVSAVAQLIDGLDPSGADPIASLGDESGDTGVASEFSSCFDPVWGRFKARVHPAIGNHDWQSGNADGYFGYWGAAAGTANQGWYSYDVGTWHVVVLSSYCGKVGGCGLGSPQVQWLKQDLAAHRTQCTLAYWHHPLFTSSPQAGTSGNTSAFWTVLYQYGADVVVNAHIHLYERFAPQDPSGNAAAGGIREFVVGTGGGEHVGWSSRAANSEAIDDSTWGVLALTLHPGSYDWRFVPAGGSFGSFADSGSTNCH